MNCPESKECPYQQWAKEKALKTPVEELITILVSKKPWFFLPEVQ